MRFLTQRHQPSVHSVIVKIALLVSQIIFTSYTQPTSPTKPHFTRSLENDKALSQRQNSPDNTTTGLAAHHWQLSKSHADVEAFRTKHNLILVDSSPTDAALQPSWPQALVQYILIAPPITCWYTSQTTHAVRHSSSFGDPIIINSQYSSEHQSQTSTTLTPWSVLQTILSPFLFIMWTISFGTAQHQVDTAGWLSVMGWALWFDLTHVVLGAYAVPMLLFQWTGSFAVIVQRWTSGFGSIAYSIDNLNGCVPVDGLAYLQQGARAHSFRLLQSITFPVATLFMVLNLRNPATFNAFLATPALAELIYTAVVASKGTPMVVSGNCLLLELNPRVGFLDSSISTRWKAFSGFMGF
ncbi:hypothetical protein E8E13_001986 [Curvularia kusanoi]|uniref:Uncharacterized protein n=1 Tax=Curvularia kusanoi TaxID=90978 RepID=A0A9P4W551_CURKU|nr:hypothetical protein E8E13_001986 [Curvularia kusanoi]